MSYYTTSSFAGACKTGERAGRVIERPLPKPGAACSPLFPRHYSADSNQTMFRALAEPIRRGEKIQTVIDRAANAAETIAPR